VSSAILSALHWVVAFAILALIPGLIGAGILAGIVAIPVALLGKLWIIRRGWQAALLQTLPMLIVPMYLIWNYQLQQQHCLDQKKYICDSLFEPLVEIISIGVIIISLIVGPLIGLRIFRRLTKNERSPE